MTAIQYCSVALSLMQQQQTFTNVDLMTALFMMKPARLPEYTKGCFRRLTPAERTTVARDVAFYETQLDLETA